MDFLSSLFGGVKNLFGGAGKAVSGALKTGGQAIGGAVNAGQSLGKNLFSGAGGISAMTPFFGGKSQAQPSISLPMIGAATGQRLGAQSGPGISMPGTTPGFNTQGPEEKKKNWLDDLFPGGTASGIAGLAAPALGNMFAPKVKDIPDFNSLSSVQAMQNFRPGNSVSPEYQQMIQNNVGQLREQRIRDLQSLYHNARPGTD